MWGIRIDRKKHDWFTKTGRDWVDESEGQYTTKANAKQFKSKKEAEASVTESWEYVAKI